MVNRSQIHFELVTLANGERLLRLSETQSGLALEKMLDPSQAVVRQKQTLVEVFEAALIRAELNAA